MHAVLLSEQQHEAIVLNPAPTADQVRLQFIESKDVTRSSKSTYSRTLRLYFEWISRKGLQHSEITRQHILQYKEDLLTGGYSPLTIAAYLTIVREFYAYAEANKYYPNVAKSIKAPKKKQVFEKEPLTEDQSRKLNAWARMNTTARDYAMLTLVQATGLRMIEVVRANIEDVTIRNEKRVLLIQGKARDAKDQLVVLTDQVHAAIVEYLATRPAAKAQEPLFTSRSNNNHGRRLTTQYVSGMIKEALRAIGLDDRNYTAHSLRHTAGTLIYAKTGRIDQVQIALRHSSPVTSQIYARKAIQDATIQHSPLELLADMF